MVSVTRDANQRIVLTPYALDDESVAALVQAIALTPESSSIIIDVADAGQIGEHGFVVLARTLANRSGPVAFRGVSPGRWASTA